MPITEECSVIKTNGDKVVIELVRQPKCDGCKACAFNKRNRLRMTANSEIKCVAGDRVVVEMPSKTVAGAWLILFVLPLILMLVAVLITAQMRWYVQVLSIVAALALGLAAVILSDRIIRSRTEYLPTVKKIVNKNIENNIGDAND